jgi:RNA polymerase sigma factor (sigma-70 family)
MSSEIYREAYRNHQRAIWGLCYRMTGSAADADDLVQDTFARAIERPPPRLDQPIKPWLVKVALNLSRDLLKKRRRREYPGPWLPGLIETEDGPPPALEAVLADGATTEARYDLMESVSLAFLIALEALSPTKRAVLLLRDVFGYSVEETAKALDLSESNVKTTLHRARKQMEGYDRKRLLSTNTSEAHLDALAKFFTMLAQGDVAGMEKLLADGVRATSDGGGEFSAARLPLYGKDKVIRAFVKLSEKRGPASWFETRELNGRPALLTFFPDQPKKQAPRVVFAVELDEQGRITELHSFLAPRKLHGIRFPE